MVIPMIPYYPESPLYSCRGQVVVYRPVRAGDSHITEARWDLLCRNPMEIISALTYLLRMHHLCLVLTCNLRYYMKIDQYLPTRVALKIPMNKESALCQERVILHARSYAQLLHGLSVQRTPWGTVRPQIPINAKW